MKKCYVCGKKKPYNEFYADSSRKDGFGNKCKLCTEARRKAFYRSRDGLPTYFLRTQTKRCKKKGWPLPEYSIEELCIWVFSQPNYDILYNNWVKSGYRKDLKPSIDRINDYEYYTFENIQLMTWVENDIKGVLDRVLGKNRKGFQAVVQLDKNGIFVDEYTSIVNASLNTGISPSCIGAACRKTPPEVGGFKWYFKDSIINKPPLYGYGDMAIYI